MQYLVILLLFILPVENISAQSDTIKRENPFSFEASIVGDGFSNFSGGLKTGAGYLGLTNIQLQFETEKARWWNGGTFHVNFNNTFGERPTSSFIGDVQGANNIEAGNSAAFQEFWYKQQIGKVNFTFGLQDMNVDFAVSKYGLSFINSSFGLHSTLSSNIAVSTFPRTSLGLTVLWQIDSMLCWKNALYDGEPGDFKSNPFNLNWRLNRGDGLFAVTEFHKDILLQKKLLGHYRAGAFIHQHSKIDSITSQYSNEVKYGFYFVADQSVYSLPNGNNLGFFAQMSYCPQQKLNNFLYAGCGISLHGISRRKYDHTGIAIAHARFREKITPETAIEAFYFCKLNKNMSIQPDLQYIINPSGVDEKLKNALVGTVRFAVQF